MTAEMAEFLLGLSNGHAVASVKGHAKDRVRLGTFPKLCYPFGLRVSSLYI